jgi:transcription elongation factor Elf1
MAEKKMEESGESVTGKDGKAMITCGKCGKDAMVEVGYAFLPTENYQCPFCGNKNAGYGL